MELREVVYLILPLLGVIGGLVIAVYAIFTDHRQRMLMIEKGIGIESKRNSSGLRSGLTFTFLGITILISFIDAGINIGNLSWYTPGGVILAIGLAQLTYYILKGRHDIKYSFRSKINTDKHGLN